MNTPTMPCSTGLHSIPNPRVGWTVGAPKTLMVGVTAANSAADGNGCGPSVAVKGLAEDAACGWDNTKETHKAPTMLSSPGLHPIPNPRIGWTVGAPKTLMVGVTAA